MTQSILWQDAFVFLTRAFLITDDECERIPFKKETSFARKMHNVGASMISHFLVTLIIIAGKVSRENSHGTNR